MGQPPRVAVLVDADNVSCEHIAFSVTGAGKHGEIVVKRAFGRATAMTGKAEILTQHGFTAEVIFPPQGNGKNAADLMLAQYATRLAERRVVEIVALVSSDGDFAPIASALAESGIRTLGFGRQDTPAAFRTACAKFFLFPARPAANQIAQKEKAIPESAARNTLTMIINDEMKGGKVHLSTLAKRLIADFGNNYKAQFGGKRVSQLIADLNGFSMKGAGDNKEWVVRTSTAQVVNLPARPAASG